MPRLLFARQPPIADATLRLRLIFMPAAIRHAMLLLRCRVITMPLRDAGARGALMALLLYAMIALRYGCHDDD